MVSVSRDPTKISEAYRSMKRELRVDRPPFYFIRGDITNPEFCETKMHGNKHMVCVVPKVIASPIPTSSTTLFPHPPTLKIGQQGLDVLVNAAGISHASSLGTTSWETIQQIINTNLNATIAMSKIFQRIAVQWTRLPIRKCQGSRQVERKPALVEEPTSMDFADTDFGPSRSRDADRGPWPCIINISSLLGVKGGSAATAYAASKAGVLGFTRALVCDHEKTATNIRVNAIVPGYIDTPMTKGEYLLMSSCHRVSSRMRLFPFPSPYSHPFLSWALLLSLPSYAHHTILLQYPCLTVPLT